MDRGTTTQRPIAFKTQQHQAIIQSISNCSNKQRNAYPYNLLLQQQQHQYRSSELPDTSTTQSGISPNQLVPPYQVDSIASATITVLYQSPLYGPALVQHRISISIDRRCKHSIVDDFQQEAFHQAFRGLATPINKDETTRGLESLLGRTNTRGTNPLQRLLLSHNRHRQQTPVWHLIQEI